MAVILVLMKCHSSARATLTVIDLMVVRQSANIFLIKVTTLSCILYELELFLNNNCIPIGTKLFLHHLFKHNYDCLQAIRSTYFNIPYL